jgi:hypothetical protein
MTRRVATSEILRRPLAVWSTTLAAMLFAIAPALNHALLFAAGNTIQLEICTAQGPKSVTPIATNAVDTSSGQYSPVSVQHCPFCLHQADRLAPPPSPLPYLLAAQGGAHQMPDWPVILHPDSSPLWAPPRGPPLTLLS